MLKNALIVINSRKDPQFTVSQNVINKLASIGISCYFQGSDKDAAVLRGVSQYSDNSPKPDFVIVVGGDGSVIDAAALAINLDLPILGVNLGRVGYLTEVEPDMLDVLDFLVSGGYRVSHRLTLVARVHRNGEFITSGYAVNDIVVSHGNYLGISEFRMEDSLGNSLKYRADGMIVSTPLGSTAYSLSSGGPVVAHDLDCMVLTPVCPHSFFNRSVVFGSAERIKITNLNSEPLNVSVDGRRFISINDGEHCEIYASDRRLSVIEFKENNMFTNLFNKMSVLEDID